MKIKKAVIPAAGLGTRMLPATKAIPKEMLPIVDKPTIQYIVEEAVASGIEDILIVVNRNKYTIEDHFDYMPELESRLEACGKNDDLERVRCTAGMANIHFVRQGVAKGLGHAVWCAKQFVGNEPFAVLLGDDIMSAKKPVLRQLIEASEKYECSSVGVQKVDSSVIGSYCSLDVTSVENRIFDVHKLIEKPRPEQVMSNYAILGRYVLTHETFNILENLSPGYGGEIQLTDGLNILCQSQRMLAVDFEGIRYDMGNLSGYLEATIQMGLQHPVAGEWLREYLKNLDL